MTRKGLLREDGAALVVCAPVMHVDPEVPID
jgi:hypothetical protein